MPENAVPLNNCGMTDLGSKDIEDLAEDPKSATVDGNSVTQHSLKEQIEAALFKAAKAAAESDKGGFAIRKFKHSGSQ